MWHSLRYGLRLMKKSPGFTLVAVLTLGLGIGANTAIFSVLEAMLLRPLPVDHPDRLVYLGASNPQQGGGVIPFSVAAYEVLRDGTTTLSSVTAFAGEGLTLTGAGDPIQLDAERVAPNFFETLGVRPIAGRSFRREEGEPGAAGVALVSQSLWERRFGSDPALLGRTITLAQVPYTVIGVVPRGFAIPREVDVWVTQITRFGGLTQDQIRNGGGFLLGSGRLKTGVTIERADAEVAALDRAYREQHPNSPDANSKSRITTTPLQEALVSNIRLTLLILAGAVALVLLIACANVASLMLARATGRAKEIAVRAALGAGRGAIVRQLLVESALVAAGGAACGIALAAWGVAAITRANAADFAGFHPVGIDLPVLAFCLGVSLATGLLFGLLPALQVSRPDLNGVLRDGGWGATAGARRHRTRSLLVAGQMALSVVLLIGAALLVESFRRVGQVDPGYDPRNAVTMSVALPPAHYPDDARRTQFLRDTLARMAAVPGVRSVSASLAAPMGIGVVAPFLAEGQPAVAISRRPLGEWKAVTPGYFETMGIPVVRGRAFTWADDDAAPRRVMVSQSLARQYFGDADPIGKRITYARREVIAEIVGVAGDVKNRGLAAEAILVFYTPYAQFAWPNMTLAARTAGDPRRFLRALESQVFAGDRDLPVTNVHTLEEALDITLFQRRRMVWLIGAFAGVALLLAVVGLYGVMAYSVAQRTTEIGIRQAVGARRADIVRMVLAQGLRLSAAGIAVGLVGAAAATRLLAGMLFHVSTTDPLTFAGIAVMFAAVGLAASWLPALRATRMDPVEALRMR